MLIDDLVTRACEEQYITRSEFRFSRREVRGHTHWGVPSLCGYDGNKSGSRSPSWQGVGVRNRQHWRQRNGESKV